MTTKALQTVIEKASALPAVLQDRLARQWLEELEDERQWDEKLATNAQTLDPLAKHPSPPQQELLTTLDELERMAKECNAPEADFSRDSIYSGNLDDPR